MYNVKKSFNVARWQVAGGSVAELQSGKVTRWLGSDSQFTIRNSQFAILPYLIAVLLTCTSVAPAYASDLCVASVIAQPVCDMDSFYGELPRQIPDGWAPFVLLGDPQFVNDPHSLFGSGTLRITSNNNAPLKAGIYTQVQVNPGAGYRASVAWAAPNFPTDAWGRQLGIDPTGGTDPNSPTVIWGTTHYGDGRLLNYPIGEGPNIDVLARAVNGTVTVFFLADLTRIEGYNLVYVDVIGLYADENAPAAVEVAATNTPAPAATDTPVAPAVVQSAPEERVADVNLISAAAAPAQAPARPLEIFVGSIDTPTSLPSDTRVIQQVIDTPTAPSPVQVEQAAKQANSAPEQVNNLNPTATWTPWPTTAPVSAFAVMGATTTLLSANNNGLPRQLSMVSLFSLVGSMIVGSVLWWMRRRS